MTDQQFIDSLCDKWWHALNCSHKVMVARSDFSEPHCPQCEPDNVDREILSQELPDADWLSSFMPDVFKNHIPAKYHLIVKNLCNTAYERGRQNH